MVMTAFSRLLPLLVFFTAAAAPAAEKSWRDLIVPAQRAAVDQALENVQSTHEKLDAQTRKNDARAVAEVTALVSRTSLPFTDEELIGKWKCRSIQGGNLGVFIYPFFACTIERREGRLFLSKTSGSQFRKGNFYADGENQRRIFLGVSYVSGDKPAGYSGIVGKDSSNPDAAKHDSVGVLVKKGKNQFVLILDSSVEEYEVYEFQR